MNTNWNAVVLTGFMGTGKSTVGRELARRLGWDFVDMDDELAARAGRPIPQIFSEDGEASFRSMEAALCRELAGLSGGRQATNEPVERDTEAFSGCVIATGGGTLLWPDNRHQLEGLGPIVCLDCSADEIVRRLANEPTGEGVRKRPLLAAIGLRGEIERLLRERADAYAAAQWRIPTTSLTVEEVVERICDILGVKTLTVRTPDGTYPVHIRRGLLPHVGWAVRSASSAASRTVGVVSNPVVAPLYLETVLRSLAGAGFQPFRCLIPDGEQHKTLKTVSQLYDQLLAGGLDRAGLVVALGGGVTGDLAGFAAATLMRGVRFAQVPTTLLAMVDASIGGKTGADLPQGKNLVGAFNQPDVVIVDPTVLSSLPPEHLRSGVAEVVKQAVISSPELFAELQESEVELCAWSSEEGATRISRALRVKIDIVEEDPFETGRRAVLNLGHTVGHALERLSDYRLHHGDGVSIGMVAAARIAVGLGLAGRHVQDSLEEVLRRWGLPVACPSLGVRAIMEGMSYDKKRREGSLRWVLPYEIGDVRIVDQVPIDLLQSVLCEMGASDS
jgi:shikimate kinase/3-dehydroquinate synthase